MKRNDFRPLWKRLGIGILTALCAFGFFGNGFAGLFARAETASSPDSRELSGFGSQGLPFLIEDEEDFVVFRNAVNAGNTFEGMYITQTADLDFYLVTNFGTIGNKDFAFEGTYDGLGHTISNLSVRAVSGESAALFYRLEGTVRNLGIESGRISGSTAASFALTSSEDAELINCYSRAELVGAVKSGGLADNFSGTIENCWYAFAATEIPLVATDCAHMISCYGTRLAPQDAAGEFLVCGTYQPFFFRDPGFLAVLNRGRTVCAANRVLPNASVKSWQAGKDGYPVFSDALPSWEGSGTREDPYRIDAPEDLVLLAVIVNSGTEFRSDWFLQTRDLDLSVIYNFMPIGIYSSGRYFFGTYDGGGHVLTDLRIRTSERSYNNALFGQLGGTVRNLGIESGEIYGANCASIASHAYDVNALVLNCYSKASVYGQARSGGIVDNFNGQVYNCIYYNTEMRHISLCSYTAYDLRSCYSTGTVYNEETFLGKWILDIGTIHTYTNRREVIDAMNKWILQYAQSYRLSYTSFARWQWSESGLVGFSGMFEVEELPDEYRQIIDRYYTDRLIVLKLALCSSVIIVLTVVVDVLYRKHKQKRIDLEKHGGAQQPSGKGKI